ncbi:MAG: diadenylate cyclase CdaA [Oligoflexales bacterium]
MLEIFERIGLWAVIDVLIIATIIYRLLLLIRGTRAMQMVLGILILIGSAFLVSQLYPLTTLKWFMDKFYSSIIIIIVILFQEDIRRGLSRMGKKSLLPGEGSISSKQILDEIIRAAVSLASKRIGALIVIERNIILSRYVDVGILLDARISKEIIESIFLPDSPIHDGAIIIQQGRITAAGCFLPLTRDDDVDPNFGTRHRAGIGISQETDAVVLVVSEESSVISLILDGQVSRNLDPKELRRVLRKNLTNEAEVNTRKQPIISGNWNIWDRLKSFKLGNKKQ